MSRVLALLFVAAPAVALAQPAPPPPVAPPPPPGDAAATPPPPAQPAPPAPYGQPQPAPYGQPQPAPYGQPQPAPYYGPPQPYGQPPYGQPYAPRTQEQLRNGMTFEVGLGVSWLHSSEADEDAWSDADFGGFAIGVGGWINNRMAVTARLADASYGENGVRLHNIFLGPSIQYWVDNHIWLGGGAGLAILGLTVDEGDEGDSINGFGLDLRAGYTFNQGSENTVNVSLELNPGFYSENDSDVTITGLMINVGYQHL